MKENHFRKAFIAFLVLLLMGLLQACEGGTSATQPGIVTNVTMAQVDKALKKSYSGNLAYNIPPEMLLNETKTIQLVISPSLSTEDLEKEITEGGQVITATVKITPKMKAELISATAGAFDVQALHADPEQFLSNEEPTAWEWYITAKKGGEQKLTMIVYRLVEVDGEQNWRQVSYANTINVEVTMGQRLSQFDWKWLLGILLAGLLIPAFWRWADQRKKKANPESGK